MDNYFPEPEHSDEECPEPDSSEIILHTLYFRFVFKNKYWEKCVEEVREFSSKSGFKIREGRFKIKAGGSVADGHYLAVDIETDYDSYHQFYEEAEQLPAVLSYNEEDQKGLWYNRYYFEYDE